MNHSDISKAQSKRLAGKPAVRRARKTAPVAAPVIFQPYTWTLQGNGSGFLKPVLCLRVVR